MVTTKYPCFDLKKGKATFMTEQANYQYNVMPFRFKNGGMTYQRMMNRVFKNYIGKTLEVNMDNMIVNSSQE